MFLKNSRYHGLANVEGKNTKGQEIRMVKLRILPARSGDKKKVEGNDQLDAIATQEYGDSTRFWYIADGNSELEANKLVEETGREIVIPDR